MQIETDLPTPPGLEGHTWRPVRRSDAAAMRRLYLACDAAGGGDDARSVLLYEADFDNPETTPATDTLAAVDERGEIAALAWVAVSQAIKHQDRARIEGAVHPAYRRRGLGDFLLTWMEVRARQIFAALARNAGEGSGDRERVLRIEFTGERADALALYERHGFELSHAEDIMRRDLRRPIPDMPLPQGVTPIDYAPEQAQAIYEVYADAFAERAGGVAWSAPAWQSAFLGYSYFRPDCSVAASAGDQLLGYVVSGIDPVENEHQAEAEGWILQIGVRPAHRRRGIAAALLCEAMRRFRAEGLDYAALDVNVNNPTARLTYERLGFEVTKRFTVYRKIII